MGKLLADSHGIELAADDEYPCCPHCSRPVEILSGPGAALVVHLVAWIAHRLSSVPILDPGPFTSVAALYAVGALVGLGQHLLVPERNPWPLRTAVAALGSGYGCLWIGLLTMPDPGACIPEPGLPWICYPALLLGAAFLLVAGAFLAEGTVRRLRHRSPSLPGLLEWSLRFLVPALPWYLPVALISFLESASGPWWEPPLVALLAGLLAGTHMLGRRSLAKLSR